MKPNLVFFTSEYPFGKSETFIENEILILSKEFDNIFLIPVSSIGKPRPIPNNCNIVKGLFSDEQYSRTKLLKEYPIQIATMFFFELKLHSAYIDSKSKLFSQCLRMVHKSSIIDDWLNNNGIRKSIFYSYWMEDWTTILSVLKSKNKIDRFISRVHGFDLFEERNINGFIPFRYFQLKHVHQVFSVSHYGKKYMQNKYPIYANKIEMSYLGTRDFGLNDNLSENKLHIVSASNIISLKRLHLIIEILKNVKISVKWTHFGDGVLMDEIIELAKVLPENIIVEFKGRKGNVEVLDFLKNKAISFFINVSDTEGLPVSIMEAISFGIPVIATDVGGTKEIVNDKTGYLIEKDFDVKNLADVIQNELISRFRNLEFRKGVRNFWKDKFSADINYTKFIKKLKELSEV